MRIDEETKEKIPPTPFMMAIHLEWDLNDFPTSKRTASCEGDDCCSTRGVAHHWVVS